MNTNTKRNAFLSLTTLSLLTFSCKHSDEVFKTPEVIKQDTTEEVKDIYSGYFSFEEESWHYQGQLSHPNNWDLDDYVLTVTKVKDSIVQMHHSTRDVKINLLKFTYT